MRFNFAGKKSEQISFRLKPLRGSLLLPTAPVKVPEDTANEALTIRVGFDSKNVCPIRPRRER